MLAVVAPGQGSQTPGFLAPWLEVPGVTERLEQLSAAAGLDLVAHGTTSDADTIRDTAVAQPLIVAAGLATAPVVAGDLTGAGAVAGHSVGELTAAALAGVLDGGQAITLVAERGRAMAAAAELEPTGMCAVLGGDPAEVDEAIARHGLVAANRNGAGQVVAAGTRKQLDGLAAEPPHKARVLPLRVAGAFHTAHMAPAVDRMATAAAGLTASDPKLPLLSNADGEVVTTGADVLARLVAQVSRPVRWDLCMQRLQALGVTGLVELPPAGALAGLAKRGLPGVEVVAVKTPGDLDAALDLVARHALVGGAA